MKKLVKGRKFNRERDQRKALLRALLSSLFAKERIKTTEAKAKEISGLADKFVTIAKKGNLVAERALLKNFTLKLTKKLILEIAPRYKDRSGGYSRIIKLGQRKTDGARMAVIELIK